MQVYAITALVFLNKLSFTQAYTNLDTLILTSTCIDHFHYYLLDISLL